MEEKQEEWVQSRISTRTGEGREEMRCVNRPATLRENWYMGWILLRSFIMKYNKEARAAAGR